MKDSSLSQDEREEIRAERLAQQMETAEHCQNYESLRRFRETLGDTPEYKSIERKAMGCVLNRLFQDAQNLTRGSEWAPLEEFSEIEFDCMEIAREYSLNKTNIKHKLDKLKRVVERNYKAQLENESLYGFELRTTEGGT